MEHAIVKVESDREAVFRFSLRSLLVVSALACILLAPTRWFGSGYLLALGVSVGLVALCVWAYCARRPGLMAVAIIASVVAGFAFMMLTLLAHAVFNSIACIAGFSWRLYPATFARLLVGTLVVVYGAAIWNGAAQIRELIALKKKYPLVSIAPRLDFEARAGEPTAPTKAAFSSPLSPGVLASLDESERDLIFHRSRPTYLRLLHEATRRQFELAAGFGVARMPTVRAKHLEPEPKLRLSLPLAAPRLTIQAEDSELEALHGITRIDFVDPERMGYVRARDEVAGFEPHAFSKLGNLLGGDGRIAIWQVTRIELVSLLRHGEPRVYVGDSLPAMDELADVGHRPLNEFERRALPELQSQEDVVIHRTDAGIEMLGAIRAGKNCLECHEGSRGKLLGAFSYELAPMHASPQTRSRHDSGTIGREIAALLP